MPRKTLAARCQELEDLVKSQVSRINSEIEKRQEAQKQLDGVARLNGDLKAQFSDLKVRIVNAENENQRMRGYIARVHEDDVVREELVTTGTEDQVRLTPKRKVTVFGEPSPFEMKLGGNPSWTEQRWDTPYDDYRRPTTAKPKHFIEY